MSQGLVVPVLALALAGWEAWALPSGVDPPEEAARGLSNCCLSNCCLFSVPSDDFYKQGFEPIPMLCGQGCTKKAEVELECNPGPLAPNTWQRHNSFPHRQKPTQGHTVGSFCFGHEGLLRFVRWRVV